MSLKLNTASGGSISLQETNTASNLTITLPAATGTVMVSGNMPAFSVYSSAAVSVPTGTFTKITFDTEDYDTNSNFASSRFTPTVAGYYQFNVTLSFSSSALVNTGGVFFYKNGARFLDGSLLIMNVSSTQFISSGGIIYCNGSTDYVEVYGFQQTGSALNIGSTAPNLKFTGSMIRGA